MLKLSDSLDAVAIFAVDIAGMATKYDFSVIRWGFDADFNCIVDPVLNDEHNKWCAVDVCLSDAAKFDAFMTDAAVAGLYCRPDSEFIHIQNVPFPKG